MTSFAASDPSAGAILAAGAFLLSPAATFLLAPRFVAPLVRSLLASGEDLAPMIPGPLALTPRMVAATGASIVAGLPWLALASAAMLRERPDLSASSVAMFLGASFGVFLGWPFAHGLAGRVEGGPPRGDDPAGGPDRE